MNTAQQLYAAGQSIWYDNIQRSLLDNGELAAMIDRGEIRGVTSNPTIFMNAITKSHDYDAGLVPLAKTGKDAAEIFWALAIDDVRAAADLFRPTYDATGGGDGYVSLEVSPYLAQDAAGTLAAAKDIWQRVDRPNLMVKIPATWAGLPAATAAIAAGINVNVTLIFSIERYAGVMDAYLKGLEKRVAAGLSLDHVASVASFFVSRVDTKVDGVLEAFLDHGTVRPGSLEEGVEEAKQQMADLETLGVSIYAVTGELEQEGVKSFADAFTALLGGVEASRKKVLA